MYDMKEWTYNIHPYFLFMHWTCSKLRGTDSNCIKFTCNYSHANVPLVCFSNHQTQSFNWCLVRKETFSRTIRENCQQLSKGKACFVLHIVPHNNTYLNCCALRSFMFRLLDSPHNILYDYQHSSFSSPSVLKEYCRKST